MDLVEGLFSTCKTEQQRIFKMGACTALAGVCAFGGSFFFTSLSPLSSAAYFTAVALTSQVAYRALGFLKEHISSKALKLVFSAIQLLQFPIWFYLLPGNLPSLFLSGAEKLEIINAAAHFLAIPIFFHLAIEAHTDPTIAKLAAAVGVLLPLGSGLGRYAQAFRA